MYSTAQTEEIIIRQSKAIWCIAALWALVALMNVVFFFVMMPINPLNLIPAVTALLAVVNMAIQIKFYNEPVVMGNSRIRFYPGWWYGKVEYPLAKIDRVLYRKLDMVLYSGGEKRILGLLYISKRDEIAIYAYLQKNSVHIIYEKEGLR